ncbi:MAG: hypothetical protein ABJG41_00035, partial [Cyclobacteriaceae bacterium]
ALFQPAKSLSELVLHNDYPSDQLKKICDDQSRVFIFWEGLCNSYVCYAPLFRSDLRKHNKGSIDDT